MDHLFDHIDELTTKYQELSLHEVIDHERFNHYSLVHHSTSIEGSTLSEWDTQLLLADGITAKGKPLAHHLMLKIITTPYGLSCKPPFQSGQWILLFCKTLPHWS